MSLFSIDIRQSLLAVKTAPARIHKKRRNQSTAYHARVQKKWTKRFGTTSTPCMFKMRDPWTGRETFVVHPSLMPALRAASVSQEQP